MPDLTYSNDGSVATICLDRPPQNRLGPQMLFEFEEAMTKVSASDARALIVRSTGDDFSHGADLAPWPSMGLSQLRMVVERVMNAFNRFESLPIPTVAAVQGACFGGGLELAIRADVIIAGESARFAHSEQELGIVTLLGGVCRVAEQIGRSRAIALALTSERVSSDVMERHGVVHRVVPDADLLKETTAFATTLANGATKAHAVHKALLRVAASGGVAAADKALSDISLSLFESEDVVSALAVAVEQAKAGTPRTAFPFKGR